jgi:hypothetical protein
MQAPVRANVQRILSLALVKRLIWHAWNSSSPCSASTRSNIVSSLCVFRTHKLSSSLLVLIRLLSSRHLNDASHRETYESAHSTILAIFAAQLGSTTSTDDNGLGVGRPTFVEKIVPFYMNCLLQVRPTVIFCFSSVVEKVQYIQNSVDGRLTTPQLRLTYNALTSSASENAPAMGQLCLSSLVSLLTSLSEAGDAQRRHRLRLVLVSTLSALPPVVLPDGLNAVSDAIQDSKDEERLELVREVFKEIMENIGDREKGYCLRWWEEQRDALEGNVEVENDKEKRIRESSSLTSRL